MEWLKFTSQYIRQRINIFWLIGLIIISLFIYKMIHIKAEILAIIVSPLFTLSILSILEERKAKWNSRYETFKTLYANRGSLLNYDVVRYLNSIDIIFIDDKEVRQNWRELFDKFKKGQELNAKIDNANPEKRNIIETHNIEQKIKFNELLNSMAISLGLNKNITQSDINSSYYPEGLGKYDQLLESKTNEELLYYVAGKKFFEKQL